MTTPHQRRLVDALRAYHAAHGEWPTVREASDFMEDDVPQSERITDDETRGLAERLEADGEVDQFRDAGGRQRYRPADVE